MTIAFHAALSLLLGRLIHPWWLAALVVFLAHWPSDLFCAFHPPNMHTPWKWTSWVRRVLVDGWQWSFEHREISWAWCAPGVMPFTPDAIPGLYNSAKLERWILFSLNLAFIVLLPLGTWSEIGWFGASDWLFVAIGWLGFDVFWAIRDAAPRLYEKIAWANPHRIVDWCARLIWPSGKPILWQPGAWIEAGMAVIMTALSLFV